MPSKNVLAASMTESEARAAGLLSAAAATQVISSSSRKLLGFSRKTLPEGLPAEPKQYIFSVSEYGEMVDLGPGLPKFEIHACPEGKAYGEPCVIGPMYFFEEVKVDVTEHTFHSGQQVVDGILKIGPGMTAAMDKRKIGWFVSATNPPSLEDVQRAVDIYTVECTRLLNEANRFAATPTQQNLNEINDTHRRAAKFLKQKVDWSKPLTRLQDCPGCGEPVKPGAIMHASPSCGYVFDWPRAIQAGMKKLEDAPDEVLKALTEPAKAKK